MLSKVPKGWRVVTLAECLEDFRNGLPYDTRATDGSLPITRIETIANGEINYGRVGLVKPDTRIEAFRLRKHDILFSHINSVEHIAKVAIKRDHEQLYHGMNLMRLRANSQVEPTFLLTRLQSDETRDHFRRACKRAVNQASLNKGEIGSYQFLLPPLDEQERIAEVLRSVDEAYARAVEVSDQCLVARNEIVDQLLHTGMPTRSPGGSGLWDKMRLGDVLSIKHGFAFSSEFFRSEDTGTILLTPGNFSVSKRLYFGPNTKFYDGPIPEGYILTNGDLLVVMTDLTQDMAILGNAVTLDAPARVLHNQRVGKVICDTSRIVSDFARLVLNSPGVQSRVKASASGSTVRHTSPGKILEIEVKLPTLEEQREIVSFALSLDRAFETGTMIAAPVMRGMARGALHEMNASLRTDLLSGRVRVP